MNKLTKAAIGAGVAAVATVGMALPAHASGWLVLDNASTGTGRWVAVYSQNGCQGTRNVLKDDGRDQGRIANSFRSHWFGWYYRSKNGEGPVRYRIYGGKCFTPLEKNMPGRIVLDGPRG